MGDTQLKGGGLQAPLIPEAPNPIRRTDTNTDEVDEFVDAEEK